MLNKMIFCISIVLIPFFGISLANANDADPEIEKVMNGYEKAWSHHDAKAIASFYHEPSMRVSKTGPTVRKTVKDQEIFFEGLLGDLVTKGYDHSDWETLNIHLMDTNTAIVSGVILRYRKDGSLMYRTAVSYGLWKSLDEWKIFWSATHAPEGVMQFK